MNIYQIDEQIKRLLIDNSDPDTGEIMNEAGLMAELEALQMNREEKQKNIILYYKNAEAEQDIIDSEIRRLQVLKRLNLQKQDRLKQLLGASMVAANKEEVDFIVCSAKFKKNPPALIIEPGADVDAYMRIKTIEEVDKKAIKADLKAGKIIPGCRVESGIRLDIS